MENGKIQKKKLMGMHFKYALSLILLLISHIPVFAQVTIPQQGNSTVFSNPLFVGFLCVLILLLVIIWVLGNVLVAAGKHKIETEKKIKSKIKSSGLKTAFVLFAFLFSTQSILAQTNSTAPVVANNLYWGLDGFTYYFMLILIAFLLVVVGMLYVSVMSLLRAENSSTANDYQVSAEAPVKEVSLFEKLNASVAIEKEKDILLDHNYDGIRELDNNLPPWWKYGFYLTIIVAVIYFFNFHVFHFGKLQLAEYDDQISAAKAEMDSLKSKNANMLDENSVKMLKDESSLASGKSIFLKNCAACHGQKAEGTVGPNLTDAYWIHKGGIKDVFKTIKYGWPEKGMKSWQQDLNAKQMQEVSSYIKSLLGTNPPNGKEKQGDLYVEEASIDSVKSATTDTVKIVQ